MHAMMSHPQRLSHQDEGNSSESHGPHSRDPRYASPTTKVSTNEFQGMENDDVSQQDPIDSDPPSTSRSRPPSNTVDISPLDQKELSDVTDSTLSTTGNIDSTSLRSSSSSASWLWSQSGNSSVHAASPSGLL